jgi:hypothetical protein
MRDDNGYVSVVECLYYYSFYGLCCSTRSTTELNAQDLPVFVIVYVCRQVVCVAAALQNFGHTIPSTKVKSTVLEDDHYQ